MTTFFHSSKFYTQVNTVQSFSSVCMLKRGVDPPVGVGKTGANGIGEVASIVDVCEVCLSLHCCHALRPVRALLRPQAPGIRSIHRRHSPRGFRACRSDISRIAIRHHLCLAS